MLLNEQQRQAGLDNLRDALRITRRQMVSGLGALPAVSAFYWGYSAFKGDPVKAAILGTGGQGRALISAINPDCLDLVAFSDIRPSNQRKGRATIEAKYGRAAGDVELVEDYRRVLDRDDVELVIVALPLHLHAPVAIEAMRKGKHVLCEKLMAKTVADCKSMVRTAHQTGRYLAIGHQRHYSYLYANALEVMRQKDIVGDVRHIRAFWHRNQTGGGKPDAQNGGYDTWCAAIPAEDRNVDYARHGYKSLDELVKWRLSNRTGAGLMAELGSHQLDACGILLGKAHPQAVSGVAVNSYFTDGREVEDHIYLTFEYPQDVVVTYSSITTNELDTYGEQVMGTRGTLAVLSEKDVYLFKEKTLKDTRITWAERRISEPSAKSTSTVKWEAEPGTPDTLASRGYREELEHLAWLIRNPGKGQPRCSGEVALADAVTALTSNIAARERRRIVFREEWFNANSEATPENNAAPLSSKS